MVKIEKRIVNCGCGVIFPNTIVDDNIAKLDDFLCE